MTSLKESIQKKYGSAAKRVLVNESGSCCGGADPSKDPITSDLYDDAQVGEVPAEAALASLGCGNPTLLAELHPGEVVLDLGSGGGIDVLLSARRVGPEGKAYGLDMTQEMLELARENQRKAGVTNVEFLEGEIENIPLPDESVDVIISNCVINLSADKEKVLREAFRVLRPGGRFAVSDIVRTKDVELPAARALELWIGCVAGALHQDEYRRILQETGFDRVEIVPTRVYSLEDARGFLDENHVDLEISADVDGAFMSAFIRAVRP